MEFDPFKTNDPSDPSGKEFKRQWCRKQLKKRTQALEESALRYILKAKDMNNAIPLIRSYQQKTFSTDNLTLMSLAGVYPDFPVLLKARRILNLANSTIGEFMDERKFKNSKWWKELLVTEQEFGGQGKPVGLVFGPIPSLRPGIMVLTKGYYDRLNLYDDSKLRLIHEENSELVVMESILSFVTSLVYRWNPD